MRRIWLFAILPVLMLWLSGCGKDRKAVTELIFERGNGSVWGHQFYIRMTPTRIAVLRYIPDGSGELTERENIPIAPEQWQAVLSQLEQLTLVKERSNRIGALFGKQDGSDFRRLTVVCGSESVSYRWPEDGQALEALLEQLVQEAAG